MKKNRFIWLLLPVALAMVTGVFFTSCNDGNDELQPKTETVAPAADDNDAISSDDCNGNTNDSNPAVLTRTCSCTSSCPIDLIIDSGTSVNVTICGDLNGTTGCTSFTSSCGSNNNAFSTTFNASGCFCVANGRSFRVTNNSANSVTFDIVVTGSMGTYGLANNVTLGSGASRDFESPMSSTCDNPVTECP